MVATRYVSLSQTSRKTNKKHRNNKLVYLVFFTLCVATLAGCQSTPNGRYSQRVDSAPRHVAKTPNTADAVPKFEPYRMFNSRPYTVLGKHYKPMTSGKGYHQIGHASWYGQKFHGHLTSNGETYNMFAMSAAHKTLPLPSYVRVTNLENNKQAIVRVNDRGPFHDDRIIDLSYAAAVKLGYHNQGTARVKLEVIHFDEHNNVTVGNGQTVTYDEYIGITSASADALLASTSGTDTSLIDSDSVTPTAPPQSNDVETNTEILPGTYIQVAALSDGQKAKSISNVLSALYQIPAHLPVSNNIYKLQLGPIFEDAVVSEVLEQLKQNGYPNAYAITQTL